MLRNDFYKVLNTTDEGEYRLVQIELNPLHCIFAGHFPDQPILPGVCTLQIIRECAEDILKKDVRIDYISSCKYLTAINPVINNRIDIKISLKNTDNNSIYLLAEGIFEEQNFIKLKASLSIV